MNSKQLHKHALPILVLSAGFCVVTVLVLSNIILSVSSSDNNLVPLVTDHPLSIKPAANGLFRISRYQPGEQANDDAALHLSTTPTGLSVIDGTGQTANLKATLAR